jgi:hypothetical protein
MTYSNPASFFLTPSTVNIKVPAADASVPIEESAVESEKQESRNEENQDSDADANAGNTLKKLRTEDVSDDASTSVLFTSNSDAESVLPAPDYLKMLLAAAQTMDTHGPVVASNPASALDVLDQLEMQARLQLATVKPIDPATLVAASIAAANKKRKTKKSHTVLSPLLHEWIPKQDYTGLLDTPESSSAGSKLNVDGKGIVMDISDLPGVTPL